MLKGIYKYYFLFCVLLLGYYKARPQSYNFTFYGIDKGLAQSQVTCIFQDSKGYIWMGTNGGGVSRFDGKAFTTINKRNGLIDNVVFSITEDKEGNVYFGTYGGLSVWDGKDFRNYTDKNGLSSINIFKVLYDKREDKVWIGTSKGPCIIKDNKIETFSLDSNLAKSSVYSAFIDHHNNIWFTTQGRGLFEYNGKRVKHFTSKNGLLNNKIFSVCEDKSGNIIAGSSEGLNVIGKNGRVDSIRTGDFKNKVGIRALLKDKNDIVWIATGTGIYQTTDFKTFKHYNIKNGLPSQVVHAVIEDLEGNIWFSLLDFGVVKFPNEKFLNFSTTDSLRSNAIAALMCSSDGSIWVGAEKGGLARFVDNKMKEIFSFDPKNKYGIISNTIYSLYEDRDKNILIGTLEGLSIFDGEKFKNYSEKDGLKTSTIVSLYQDTKGNYWIGTALGVNKMENGKIIPFDPDNDIAKERVYDICEDKRGNIWFATENGAVSYSPKSGKINHFKDDSLFTSKRVVSLYCDKSGVLWFGTKKGLFKYDEKNFICVNEENGLPTNNIYSILADDQQNIWIGTNRGISKFDYRLFERTGKISIKNFGREDGFIGVECNLNASAKDKWGRIWFGTIAGVTVYNPRYDKINTVQPITNISKLKLNFEDFDFSSYCDSVNTHTHLPVNLVLPYNKNHLTFEFIGLSFTSPEKVRYQWMLEGFDENFSPVSNKTEATYSNIPPGTYTFKVKACNNDGIWNELPTEFSFTITPPFWKTWWFTTLWIIIAILGIVWFIRYRTEKLERDKRLLEKEVAERTAEIVQQKEEIEAQRDELSDKNYLIELKNKDITDSINYAKRIQDAILPSMEVIKEGFPDCFVLYHPKDIVSGDFYWCSKRNDRYFIAAVDCTGHGVPGAFMSMIGQNLLNKIVIDEGVTEPGKILQQLNNGVKQAFSASHKDMDTKDGMDIALISFFPGENKISYAGANRPLYFVRNSKLEEIKATKNAIGGFTPTDFEYTMHEFDLLDGDAVYFTSDGYADQFGGPDGKKFMTKKLKELLLHINSYPMNEQKNLLDLSLQTWKEGYEQVDDVLVIGLKFNGKL